VKDFIRKTVCGPRFESGTCQVREPLIVSIRYDATKNVRRVSWMRLCELGIVSG